MTRRWQALLFLGGAAAFALLVARAGPARLLAELRGAGWAVVPVVLVYAAVYAAYAAAWRLAMLDAAARLPAARVYAVTVAAFALNVVTPVASVGGEPFKILGAAGWMGRRGAAASVLNSRFVHVQAHLLVFLTAVALAFVLLPRGAVGTVVLVLLAAVLVALAALLFALHRRGVLERLLDLLHRVPLLRRLARRLESRRAALVEIDRQLVAFRRRSPRRYVGALATEYAGRAVGMLEYVVIARAVGVPVDFWTAFLIGGFSSLVVNLLFFIPLNLGSKEGGLYVIFRLLGLPPELGVAAAILSRLREFAWIAIGLLLVLTIRGSPNDSRE